MASQFFDNGKRRCDLRVDEDTGALASVSQKTPQTTFGLSRNLRRFSAAVAAPRREGHRQQSSGRAGQHLRWDRGRKAALFGGRLPTSNRNIQMVKVGINYLFNWSGYRY